MSVLRVAIVGLGIGKAPLEAYARLPALYRVSVLCDLDRARAQEAASGYGAIFVETDFAKVLARDDVDVIDICTPPNQHFAMIEQSVAAGRHVVCEKPLVGSLRDCDALIELQNRSRAKIVPIFQYRWGRGLQRLKHLVDRGIAGKAYLATIETSWRREADYYAVAWRGKYATELGGVCLTQAIHAHDMLSYLNGPVAKVFARTATRVNPIEVEDCAAASLEMADGSLATLSATLGASVEISRLRFMYENLTAESQSPEPYRPGKDPWIITGKTPEAQARIDAALAGFKPGLESFEGQFAAMHAALTTGAPSPVSLQDARRSLELITALYHSAATGTAVRLPVGAEHPLYAGWVPGLKSSIRKAQ